VSLHTGELGAKLVNLAVEKFGLRALAQSMSREYGLQGHSYLTHCAGLTLGLTMLKTERKYTLVNPNKLAEVYWNLHCQDPTVWTFELDVETSCRETVIKSIGYFIMNEYEMKFLPFDCSSLQSY
jgi:hypothetical protein